MRWSLAQILDAATPHLDGRLAAAQELTCVRSFLASLPAAISDWISFEFRLWPRDPRIDLVVRVDRAHSDGLASGRPQRGFPDPAQQSAWQRASAFATIWNSHAGWAEAIESLSLAFDFDAAAVLAPERCPQPRFFVDLARPIRKERSADSWWGLACDAIALLAPQVPSGEITRSLRRSVIALPAGASLRSVGLPGADAAPGVRACLTGITKREVPSFARTVGLTGDLRVVSDILDGLLESTPTTSAIDSVDLDLTANGPRRLAIGLAFARKPQLRGRIEERRLLENLVRLGLADDASIAALGAWPGCEIARLPHVFWPALLVRRLDHVKLVFEGDRVAAVDALPCVFHRFSPQIARRACSIDRALDCGCTSHLHPMGGPVTYPASIDGVAGSP